MTKKALSVILSALMSVTAFQTTIIAEGEGTPDETSEITEGQEIETTEEITEEIEASGEENENLEEPEEEVQEVTEETPEVQQETEEPEETAEEPAESEEPSTVEEEPGEEDPALTETLEESEKIETPEEEGEEPAEITVTEETPETEETEEPEEVTLITPEAVTYNGVTVSVSYYSDTFGGKEVTMVVGEPGEKEKAALEALGGTFKAVDITFVDAEGNPVQPEEGKNVSVSLKAEGMENTGEYEAVHVDAEGNVTLMDAASEVTNTVTQKVKVGETTRTVEVPAETEIVEVQDYKDVPYTTYELVEKTVEVPEVIGYRYVRKSREVEVPQNKWGFLGWRQSEEKQTRTEYYYEREPYVVREAYSYTTWTRVPVQKTWRMPAGTHNETRVVKEAYSYEETDEIFEDVQFNEVQTTFGAESFSVYAVVAVGTDGSLDFDGTFGADHIVVQAPAGAFEEGTVMKIETVDDPNVLANALKALGDNTYNIYGIDISFWLGDQEVEPQKPVKVTWTSDYIKAGDTVVHINDDGTAEKVTAIVQDNKTIFITDQFSTYTTTRQNEINLLNATEIIFNPSNITRPETMASGYLSSTAPEIDGYTFKNATIVRGNAENTTDPVVYLGEFIYREFDDDGHQIGEDQTYIYYRTQSTVNDSDLIVKLAADEMIKLNYESTPLMVTYRVVYNNTTYNLNNESEVAALQAVLGDDYDALSLVGPDSIAQDTGYEQAVTASIPRGYSATITRNGNNMGGLGVEPTYSATRDTVTKSGNYELDGVFTIPAQNTDQVITLNLEKRTSYTYDASKVVYTKYFGGGSTARYKNSTVAGRSGTSNTFTSNTAAWVFSTTTPSGGTCWIMDSLEVNGEAVAVPFTEYGSGAQEVQTTLKSGTVITVRVEINNDDYATTSSGRRYYSRKYTVTASNCYENITISGGNLYNAWSWAEYMPDVLDNVTYDYRFQNNGAWNRKSTVASDGTFEHWPVSQPISIGRSNENDKMYHYSNGGSTMRFKVDEGYSNPQMAFVSSSGTDLMSNVYLATGLSKGTADSDYYYPITGNPDANGYYYFSVNGMGSNTFALLRIKASLTRYGVSYEKNNDEVVFAEGGFPSFDNGGEYEDGTLRGYNVVDNNTIAISKIVPEDTQKKWTFLYYTIDGDTSGKTYAPSQKVPLSEVAEFAKYDSESGEYVIPFVAQWKETEQVETLYVTARVYLDFGTEPITTVRTEIPKNSSVYIDIDSDTMAEIMDQYNWQLFYDEEGSNPFVENITESTTVELHLYSKFYVYHSGTGKLELHTTKELKNTPNHTLDITKFVPDGYLYGGYYMDYAGAHEGNDITGTNLVKVAADYNNNEGTLTSNEIKALSKGEGVQIKDKGETIGTPYSPNTTAAHVGYWKSADAFTASLKTPADTWYSNRGSKDTEVLQSGGKGTEVKVARAGIYYLKEVPTCYLQNYHQIIFHKTSKELQGLYLLTAIDDTNYNENGFTLKSSDGKTATVVKTFTIKNASGSSVVLKPTTIFKSKGLIGDGYLGYWDVTGTDYFTTGSFTILPYWETPDEIKVDGISTRTVTISAMTKAGITKTDE